MNGITASSAKLRLHYDFVEALCSIKIFSFKNVTPHLSKPFYLLTVTYYTIELFEMSYKFSENKNVALIVTIIHSV
jgi:hypothetical protein